MIDRQQKIREKAILVTSMLTRYSVEHIKKVLETANNKGTMIVPMVDEVEKILTEGIHDLVPELNQPMNSFNKDQDEQT